MHGGEGGGEEADQRHIRDYQNTPRPHSESAAPECAGEKAGQEDRHKNADLKINIPKKI